MYFFKSRSLDGLDGAHCNSIHETEDHKFKSRVYCIVKSHLKEKKKATLGLVLSSYFIFISRRTEEINQWLKILLHKQEKWLPLQSHYPSLSSYRSRWLLGNGERIFVKGTEPLCAQHKLYLMGEIERRTQSWEWEANLEGIEEEVGWMWSK